MSIGDRELKRREPAHEQRRMEVAQKLGFPDAGDAKYTKTSFWTSFDWASHLKFADLEKKHGLSQYPGLLHALMKQESGGDPAAKGTKEDSGLFQFIPTTAQEYKVDPWNPHSAAEGAAKKMGDLLKQHGDIRKALSAYNSGSPERSLAYADKVLARMPEGSHYASAAQDHDSEGDGVGGSSGFLKKGSVGGILGLLGGGGIGLIIGRFLGGLFNDGSFLGNLMGMFLTAALTIGGALMGGNKIGGWINGKLGLNDTSPKADGPAQGKDVNQPSATRAPQAAATPDKVGGFTADELKAVLNTPDMKQDVVRLRLVGNEVKLAGVVSDDTNTNGVIDVAPLMGEQCSRAQQFEVVRVPDSTDVKVNCVVPSVTAAKATSQTRG